MNTLFFRLLSHEDKATALSAVVVATREGRPINSVVYTVDPASFRQVPGLPFAYWVSESARSLFCKSSLIKDRCLVASGTGTLDDFRFLRLWFEVPTYSIPNNAWFPFAKGGAYSPYYFDHHLIVNWQHDGAEMKAWIVFRYGGGHWARNIRSTEHYFRPGLTWPRRTNGLSFRVLPAGCIFADKGPAAFVENDVEIELLALCAILNSRPFGYLVTLQLARTQLAQSYEVGLIQQTPIPDCTPETTKLLANLTRCAWSLKRSLDTASETSHVFLLPALLQVPGESLTARALTWAERVRESTAKLAHIQAEIDEHAFKLYGIHSPDRENMLGTSYNTDEVGEETDNDAEDNEGTTPVDTTELIVQLLSYGLGLTFKRFDLDLALGRRSLPSEPEPFAPLPVCSPGMLLQEHGLPAAPEDASGDYPLRISWPGILVDDEGHPEDIIGRVREAMEVLWPERASDIEHEACEILGVRSLRDYFARPNHFFASHLKRCSKSRRQAPIYWPLQTPSGSYTLWLYYHRLTDQMLYTCINDFVGPRFKQLTEQLDALRAKTRRSKQEEKDLDRLLDFEQELTGFRDELLRVARFWKPNLNDGVQITAAPLWKLFQHRPWQKTLQDTWNKLAHGAYDWAHLAYSIWPERVREKCQYDKSLAIAHGLEELYAAPPEQPRKKRGRTRE